MSKHDKFRDRLCARPTPSGIKWTELKSYLEHLGYQTLTGKGSRRKFFHSEKDDLIICHEPHPSPSVDKALVVEVIEHLKAHNFI